MDGLNGHAVPEEHFESLRNYYKNYQLTAGCTLAAELIEQFPNDSAIVRWWALFYNRLADWSTVRKRLLGLLNSQPFPDLHNVCNLAIFESYLNSFGQQKSQQSFDELSAARQNYLENVLNKETNGQYYYFLARYFEEEWWMDTKEKNVSDTTILYKAVKCIDWSIELYESSISGYQSMEKVPWWLFCHRCLLLKLIDHPSFEKNLTDYRKMILELMKLPHNIQMKSMQTYAVAYYLLMGSMDLLLTFFDDLKHKVSRRKQKLKLKQPIDEISIVDNFTYHHVDMIYHADEDRREVYYKILDNWFKKQID
jgi:hypothetical protein